MTAQFTLHFYDRDGAGLWRTEFQHPLLSEPRQAIRGQSRKSAGIDGSFQWTSAVQALSILVLKSKAWGELPEDSAGGCPQPVLSGGKSSPACSLDYALSKQPAWLLDMFGVDSGGGSITRRIFQRHNPEGRYPGPVMICLNTTALQTKNIHVLYNEQEVLLPSHFFAIAEDIECKRLCGNQRVAGSMDMGAEMDFALSGILPTSGAVDVVPVSKVFPQAVSYLSSLRQSGLRPRPFQSEDWLSFTKANIKMDIVRSLCSTDIFSPEGTQRLLKSMNENPSFIQHAGAALFNPQQRSALMHGLPRLGIAESEDLQRGLLCTDEPLRVVASLGPGANLAICTYLRQIKGYNIEVHYKYRSSTDLVNQLIDGDVAYQPDVLIMSPGAAALLLSSCLCADYVPCTLMPARPHAVLVPDYEEIDHNNPYDGHYLVCDHGHKRSCFYFDSLVRNGIIDTSRIEIEHVSYEEALQALREKRTGLRISSSLEYLRLFEWFHHFSILETSRFEMCGLETVLFMHRSLAENEARARALEIAIRDAWLDLAEDSEALELTLDLILEDRAFLKIMKRSCGLYGSVVEHCAYSV